MFPEPCHKGANIEPHVALNSEAHQTLLWALQRAKEVRYLKQQTKASFALLFSYVMYDDEFVSLTRRYPWRRLILFFFSVTCIFIHLFGQYFGCMLHLSVAPPSDTESFRRNQRVVGARQPAAWSLRYPTVRIIHSTASRNLPSG
ncbi:hypothetical protein BDR06DRAFT_177408 [Suillus hirtellus]|nr:hypothetical protein BDR06DRAFT_177408 [Suillus hirtellus]